MSITPELLAFTPSFINLGVPELSIIVLLVLILFGPGKLPGVMKSLGDGVRQFKDASNTANGHRPAEPTYQAQPNQAALPPVSPQALTAQPTETQLAAQRQEQQQHQTTL